MNSESKKKRLEPCIRLAQEWKLSGMTQAEYARSIGMTVEAVKYRIRKVRENAPEMLTGSELTKIEFVQIPQEFGSQSDKGVYEEKKMADRPVLMIQSAGACLQATNQIEPYLLKTAMEVMLTC